MLLHSDGIFYIPSLKRFARVNQTLVKKPEVVRRCPYLLGIEHFYVFPLSTGGSSMSAQPEDQHAQTPSEVLSRLEEAFVLVDPAEWGALRSQYAHNRVKAQRRIDASRFQDLELQDAYLGAQLLLFDSSTDQLFIQRMESMAELVSNFAIEQTALPKAKGIRDRLGFKAGLLEHYSLELCVVSAAAVLYGPVEHIGVLKAVWHKLLRTSSNMTQLENYPTLLFLYATGVAAVISENAHAFRELTIESMYLELRKNLRVGIEFDLFKYLNTSTRSVETKRQHRQTRDWIAQIISMLTGASDAEVSRAIMMFELLYYLPKPHAHSLPNIHALDDFFRYQDCQEDVLSLITEMKAQQEGWFRGLFQSERQAEIAFLALTRLFAERREPKSPGTPIRHYQEPTDSEPASDAGSNEECE